MNISKYHRNISSVIHQGGQCLFWHIPMVDLHVGIPCAPCVEPLVTVLTLARFLLDAHMDLLHMPFHVDLREVGLVTMGAGVFTLLSRDEPLSAEVHLVVCLIDGLGVCGVGAELTSELAGAPKRMRDFNCRVLKDKMSAFEMELSVLE